MEERIIKDINNLLTRLFQKMEEAGYEWDEEKKEFKKIKDEPDKCEGCNNAKGCVACVDGSEWAHIEEHNPAWSEEDENAIGMAIIALDDLYDEDSPDTTYGGYNLPFNKAAERLNSIKDKCTWKPSDKQMGALANACDGKILNLDYLNSLYQDLKKLKG